MNCAVDLAHAHDGARAAASPFWFDLWQVGGWSRRVARNWQQETAYRDPDSPFLNIVLPTLAPADKAFVARVLEAEGR